MLSDEEKEKAWSETEIRFRADLLILNSEFPTHRKTEAMEELLEIYNKQSKEIEKLKVISEYREKIIKGLGLKTLPKTITGFKELIENNNKKWEDKIKAKIEEKFLEAKGLYERGVQPQAQYTMKLLRDLEKSLLEKE